MVGERASEKTQRAIETNTEWPKDMVGIRQQFKLGSSPLRRWMLLTTFTIKSQVNMEMLPISQEVGEVSRQLKKKNQCCLGNRKKDNPTRPRQTLVRRKSWSIRHIQCCCGWEQA